MTVVAVVAHLLLAAVPQKMESLDKPNQRGWPTQQGNMIVGLWWDKDAEGSASWEGGW